MIAICTIRPEPHYRRDAFLHGLARVGYTIVEQGTPKDERDLLVMWNRQGEAEQRADNWEARGGTVVVAENGYMGRDSIGRQFYAIAVHGHNGSGWFPVGDEDRFAQLGIELKPWCTGGYDLVCGQRGIGSRTMKSPNGWHSRIAARLLAMKRRTKVRVHPGNHPAKTTLEADLGGAGACAIWSSSSGIVALTRGVPVAYFAPHWIAAAGAIAGYDGIVAPLKDDAARLAALQFTAWGQRSIEEIEAGEPFDRMLEQIGDATW